jgi:DNA-binding response OmpR family regulator
MAVNKAKEKILVIDDEQDVVAYLKTWLTDEGYEVETAKDGIEGLEKFKTFQPDLVTLDIIMPQKTGLKLYREIKGGENPSPIPVIVITGLQQEFKNFISHRRAVPAPDGYIAKPFSREELLGTLQSVLSKRAANR